MAAKTLEGLNDLMVNLSHFFNSPNVRSKTILLPRALLIRRKDKHECFLIVEVVLRLPTYIFIRSRTCNVKNPSYRYCEY